MRLAPGASGRTRTLDRRFMGQVIYHYATGTQPHISVKNMLKKIEDKTLFDALNWHQKLIQSH
jgi:hypothetical protein